MCDVNVTGVGWDRLHQHWGLLHGGCFNENPSQEDPTWLWLEPALPPHLRVSHSFDLFLIAIKQAKTHLLPTTHQVRFSRCTAQV